MFRLRNGPLSPPALLFHPPPPRHPQYATCSCNSAVRGTNKRFMIAQIGAAGICMFVTCSMVGFVDELRIPPDVLPDSWSVSFVIKLACCIGCEGRS